MKGNNRLLSQWTSKHIIMDGLTENILHSPRDEKWQAREEDRLWMSAYRLAQNIVRACVRDLERDSSQNHRKHLGHCRELLDEHVLGRGALSQRIEP